MQNQNREGRHVRFELDLPLCDDSLKYIFIFPKEKENRMG